MFYLLCYLLFERRQIFCSSATRISSSRKSGWAMLISASARCQRGLPVSEAIPYFVTIFGARARGVVILSPAVNFGTMFE